MGTHKVGPANKREAAQSMWTAAERRHLLHIGTATPLHPKSTAWRQTRGARIKAAAPLSWRAHCDQHRICHACSHPLYTHKRSLPSLWRPWQHGGKTPASKNPVWGFGSAGNTLNQAVNGPEVAASPGWSYVSGMAGFDWSCRTGEDFEKLSYAPSVMLTVRSSSKKKKQ